MAIDITINGVAYSVPSNAADTNWAQDQVVFEQALASFLLTPPTWTAPALINSWANVTSNAPAKFYRDTASTVHLRFALKTGTSGTVAFVLASGYRPPFPVAFNAPGVTDPTDTAVVTIATNGNVTITDITGNVTADGCFLEAAFSTVA